MQLLRLAPAQTSRTYGMILTFILEMEIGQDTRLTTDGTKGMASLFQQNAQAVADAFTNCTKPEIRVAAVPANSLVVIRPDEC